MGTLKIKTKTNIWLSKEYLTKIYKHNKPEWVNFCEQLLDNNFEVFLYLPEKKTSVYITVVKNNKMQTIRFSDHQTKQENWLKADVDYYVGPAELGMLTQKEVYDALSIYFR